MTREAITLALQNARAAPLTLAISALRSLAIMIFLRTNSGRVAYPVHRFEPWGPWQVFHLRDLESGDAFNAFAKDLTVIPEPQVEELERKVRAIERDRQQAAIAREQEALQTKIAKHVSFVEEARYEYLGYELIRNLPPHGYLQCSLCGLPLTLHLNIQCKKCTWPICSCGACRCGTSTPLHPEHIDGPWKSGFTLDVQTLESHCIGEDEQGHPIFETRRSEVGELLYQFKYQSNRDALKDILTLAAKELLKEKRSFDIVVPVPPSNPARTVTMQIAAGLAASLASIASGTALTKARPTDELKSIADPETRKKLLTGAFAADPRQLRGKTVLLVDDLYRSGATLEAATEAAYGQGHARAVYVFAVTRTRVHR